jgi:hypothetical protein
MKRTYLEEDMELIQKYFPGARSVSVRTPFDLSAPRRRMTRLSADNFHDTAGPTHGWILDTLWTN